jgi:hypothetical protein
MLKIYTNSLGSVTSTDDLSEDFHKLQKHSTNALRRVRQWIWGKPEEKAFQELKQRICEEPVLLQPDQTKPFEVEVDTSNYAIGAVLMQRNDENILHPVAFFSKTMNKAQRNYDVYNRELLGLRETLRTWRPYLHQAKHKVKVHTDHANLLF